MYISGVWVISSAGEVLVSKKYRNDLTVNPAEIFQEKMTHSLSGSILPHMQVAGGVHLYHLKRHEMYLLAACARHVIPIIVIEVLTRLHQLMKDFCGTLDEQTVRSNVFLIKELLTEFIDNGFVQQSNTERLRPYIQSEPACPVSAHRVPGPFGLESVAVPSTAADRSVIKSGGAQDAPRNEVFIDVIERLTTLISSVGEVMRCEVEGQMKVKSFLPGSTQIRVALNEDLTVGLPPDRRGFGHTVHMDECSFHQCVDIKQFDTSHVMTINPPEGEFTAMSYSIRGRLALGLPLRVYSLIKSSAAPQDVNVQLKIRCEAPSGCYIKNLSAHLPVPRSTSSISQRLDSHDQSASFITADRKIIWKIQQIKSKCVASAQFTLIGAGDSRTVSLGPLALEFEVSGFLSSNLKLAKLDLCGYRGSVPPQRWVRLMTLSGAYLIKLTS